MTNKPKSCDTLAIEILDKVNDCLRMCMKQELNKPKSYDNFVLLTRTSPTYNTITISDGNLYVIIQREWADEDQLTVLMQTGDDKLELLDFMKSVSEDNATSEDLLELEKSTDEIKTVCAELYDIVKSKPV